MEVWIVGDTGIHIHDGGAVEEHTAVAAGDLLEAVRAHGTAGRSEVLGDQTLFIPLMQHGQVLLVAVAGNAVLDLAVVQIPVGLLGVGGQHGGDAVAGGQEVVVAYGVFIQHERGGTAVFVLESGEHIVELIICLRHLKAKIVQPVLTADHAEEGADEIAHQLVEAADVTFGGHSGLGKEPGGGTVLGVVGEQILIVLQGDDDLFLDGVILAIGVHGVEAAEDIRIVAGGDGQVELLAGHHHIGLNEFQSDAGELKGLLIPAGIIIAVGQSICGSSAGTAHKVG